MEKGRQSISGRQSENEQRQSAGTCLARSGNCENSAVGLVEWHDTDV